MFDGKQVIVIGERDGVAGPAIAACVQAAGAAVAFAATECFVWTAAGAMDLSTQETIKRLVDEHGADALLVLLGAPDAESAGIAAETVVLGDPSWAGPLAGVQLGLPVYHILEDEARSAVPVGVWEEQVGLMVDVLEVDAIAEAVREFREHASR
jgi:glycine/sarcosine/betaine reductase complex component A